MIGTANEFNNMWILDVLLKFLCLSTVSTLGTSLLDTDEVKYKQRLSKIVVIIK